MRHENEALRVSTAIQAHMGRARESLSRNLAELRSALETTIKNAQQMLERMPKTVDEAVDHPEALNSASWLLSAVDNARRSVDDAYADIRLLCTMRACTSGEVH